LIALSALVATPRITDASSCVPGFDYGAFGKLRLDWGGNSGVDSWNSSLGTYAATKSNSGGNLGTDGTGNGDLRVHGTASTVFGDLYIGAGASTSNITINGHPTTGSEYALTSNLNLPSVTLPSGYPSGGNISGTAAVAGIHYGTASNVTFGTGTFYVDTLSGSVTITGSAVIYVGSSFSASSITNASGIPGNAVFMCGSSVTSINLTNVGGYYAVYAPDASIGLHGNKDVYGSLVGKDITVTGTPAIHYDKALQNFAGGGFSCAATEISRAAPVTASITSGGTTYTAIVQGTFEKPTGSPTTLTSAASISAWTFPYIKGHMRARDITTVDGTSYSNGTVLFDAGASGKIPTTISTCNAPYNGTCRAIFTNTNSTSSTGTTFGSALDVKTLDYTNATTSATIGALIATGITGLTTANYQSIIQKIQQAGLGGVDRSTPAVIQNSSVAGNSARPKMAYFGATDGMIHAVCASTGGTTATGTNICPSLGTELWAFLPRVQLPLIKTNVARVDGSVRVTDMYGDFTSGTGTGTRSWRTILTIETGYSLNATPAVYAIDVTDPASPSLLWEVTAPSSAAAVDLGAGLTLAAGPVQINGVTTNVVVASTNNGGTASATTAAIVAQAIQAETGAKLWQFSYSYPNPPRGNTSDAPLMPYTGIPGGAVGVDLAGNGYFTDFVFGDLYGDLWRVKASDGTSRNGTNTPLFAFSTNKHPIGAPPAIYSDGNNQYAAFATGGYADPVSTGFTTNSPAQRILAIKLSYTGGTLTEATSATVGGNVAVNQALSGAAASDKSYSQALVVGNQLFVTSDTSDVNLSTYGTTATNTGHLTTVNLSTASTGTVVSLTGATGGAASVVNNGTSIYTSGSVATATSATGTSVDLTSLPKVVRNLWLRTM
jgi:hypothetical protein